MARPTFGYLRLCQMALIILSDVLCAGWEGEGGEAVSGSQQASQDHSQATAGSRLAGQTQLRK